MQKKLPLIIILIAIVAVATGCSALTVKFDSAGGSPVEIQKVNLDGLVAEPAAPVKEGYTFGGWYLEPEHITRWSFSAKVETNITLYAKWTPKYVSVIFDLNDGTATTRRYSGYYGDKLEMPPAPLKDDFIFDGWYKDKECTEVFTASTFPSETITVYAKWSMETELFSYERKGNAYAIAAKDVAKLGSVVYLPEKYNGLPIVAIRDGGFKGSKIKEVVLPNALMSIGAAAFKDCGNLNKINLDNVLTIGDEAFYGCGALKEANFSGALKNVGKAAFYRCSALSSVALKSDAELGNRVFAECAGLQSADLSAANDVLPADMFYGCVSLRYVSLPKQLKEIGEGAFEGCEALPTLTLPTSLETLGSRAFAYSGITTIAFPDLITVLPDKVMLNCNMLLSVELPENLVEVEEYAFQNCRKLTAIDLPLTLEKIGEGAFEECRSITYAALNGVKEISSYAFAQCVSLEKAVVSSVLENIGEGAFSYCSALSEIKIPKTVCAIGDKAFFSCVSLRRISIPTNLEYLGNEAFMFCTELSYIKYEEINVKYFGVNVFAETGWLSNLPDGVIYMDKALYGYKNKLGTGMIGQSTGYLRVPNSCRIIASGAFRGCKELKKIEFGGPVDFMGDGAFAGSGLTEVTLPQNLTDIGAYMFADCADLKSVTFAGTEKKIGYHAFYRTPLTEVRLPDSATIIDREAFASCVNLRRVYLGKGFNPRNIASYIGESAFADCPVFTSLIFSNENYVGAGNSSFLRYKALPESEAFAIYLPDAFYIDLFRVKDSLQFDPGWKNNKSWIPYFSFGDYLDRLYTASNIVGDFALSATTLIQYLGDDESLELDYVTHIGKYAFAHNATLKNITLKKVTDVAKYAFSSSAVVTVTFEGELTKLGEYAFYDCKNLKEVRFNTTEVPALGKKAFYVNDSGTDVIADVKIYVPPALRDAYLEKKEWAEYADKFASDEP